MSNPTFEGLSAIINFTMDSISGTTLLGVEKNSTGLYTKVLAQTADMTLDTTASRYAIGCEVVNTADGKVFYNTGSTATPVWESEIISKTVSLTAAQIIAMYATPVVVIPAVSGKTIVLDSFIFDLTGTATQFTGGGVVNLQYKSTANGAGTALHADIAAAVVTGATGNVKTLRTPADLSAVATADIDGQGVYISNKTGAFAAGTGTASLRVKYHLI